MCSWDIEEGLDCQGDICGVVKTILVRDFGVSQVLEEALVLILSDFTLVTIPDGLKGIDQLTIQLDRICYEQ
jgi:hypothetical protein